MGMYGNFWELRQTHKHLINGKLLTKNILTELLMMRLYSSTVLPPVNPPSSRPHFHFTALGRLTGGSTVKHPTRRQAWQIQTVLLRMRLYVQCNHRLAAHFVALFT